MIGKIVSRRRDGKSSFHAITEYIAAAEEDEKCTYIGSRNLAFVDFPGTGRLQDFITLAAAEMAGTAAQNNRIKEPVFHAIASWPPGEMPTQRQIEEAINIISQGLNLEECQCVYGRHQNTEHTHLHIAFNRVHPETYKAIDPAHGWTKKALEKAMREIEIKQGWGRELNGKHYTIINEQVVPVKSLEKEQSLTQKVMDFEAHTGEESAQSKIRGIIPKNLMDNIKNWGEFKAELAALNIVYEKKGSGAIFRFEGQEVKASNIAKKYGFARLEKQLGTYFENKTENKIGSKTNKENWESRLWQMRRRHNKERSDLGNNQRERRAEALKGNWKGRGAERNYLQSIIAVKFSKERRELKDKQKQEREAFVKEQEEAITKKRGRGNFVDSITATPKEPTLPEERGGIFGLEVIRVAGGAGYREKGQTAPLVVDTGTRIRTTKVSESAVLATLQLAASKWGGCEVHGSKQYKAMCVELAVKNNIKITNPELQNAIIEIRNVKVRKETKKLSELRARGIRI